MYPVNRTKLFDSHCAGLCDGLHVAVSSKKIVDPNEQEGESILLSKRHGEIFEPAQDLNRKKE